MNKERVSMKKLLFLLLYLLPFTMVKGQKIRKDTILLSGIVFDADSSKPLGNVNILLKKKPVNVSDRNGYFEVWVSKGDTVFFSYLGFKEGRIIMPPGLTNPEYFTSVALSRETVTLKEVEVFPWPKTSLRQALINTNVEDKNLTNAQRNLNIANYEALSTTSATWTKDQIQRYYIEQFTMQVTSNDKRNALEAGVITPATSVLNTNTLIGLIILARQLKDKELKQKNYQDYKKESSEEKK
jgi:hypothetical protein